jgi:dipeptidyl-peptidase-4
MHELAHSYHHCVLGHGNPDIREAYDKAVESGHYESVLHINGSSRRAYALNNDKEYFAEATEAFFGTNDFYPFVRSELQKHDPDMYQVLRKLWKVQ